MQFVVERMRASNIRVAPPSRPSSQTTLIRLQRREYYRLATPIVKPIKCLTSSRTTVKSRPQLPTSVLGGMAITHYQDQTSLTNWRSISTLAASSCQKSEPSQHGHRDSQRTRNHHEERRKKSSRAGCMFIDLPPSQQAMIQRYITKLDRERLSQCWRNRLIGHPAFNQRAASSAK